jgi:hypothetical protein
LAQREALVYGDIEERLCNGLRCVVGTGTERLMPQTTELWYIRFPNGRVLRAAGAATVRQQLAAGRLPSGTQLRRSLDDEWRGVERYPEFADLAPTSARNGIHAHDGTSPPATITSRLDPTRLRLVGVRGLVEDLVGALDSMTGWSKLQVAALAGLFLGVLAALARLAWLDIGVAGPGLAWLLPIAALLVWSWLGAVLSRMTYVEVTRLRPARWRDGLTRCFGATVHLALAQAVVAALVGGAIFGLRWLPGWLLTAGNDGTVEVFEAAAQAVAVLGMLLEVVLWPTFLAVLLLGAVVVVEQCSFLSALRQWGRLVWQCPGRLFLAEGLVLGVGLLLALPLGLLVYALSTRPIPADFAVAATLTQCILGGLLGSVVLAYVVVANVFVYLKLRYER